MRRLLTVVPALLLASFAVPCLTATAAPPTDTPANNSKNQRVTLYSDGQVVAVLMFYRTSNKTPQFIVHANQAEVNTTNNVHTLRLKGNVSIKHSSAKGNEKGIMLTADEAVIETLSDRPLPDNF